MKEVLSILCNINRKEQSMLVLFSLSSALKGRIWITKIEEMWFHFLFKTEEQCGAKSLYFICLVSDIENVLSKECEHFRKMEIHINWINSLFKTNLHSVFPFYLDKNLSNHTKGWKWKKPLGIYE